MGANGKQYLIKVRKETYERIAAAAEESHRSITEMGDMILNVKMASLADSASKGGAPAGGKVFGGPDYKPPEGIPDPEWWQKMWGQTSKK